MLLASLPQTNPKILLWKRAFCFQGPVNAKLLFFHSPAQHFPRAKFKPAKATAREVQSWSQPAWLKQGDYHTMPHILCLNSGFPKKTPPNYLRARALVKVWKIFDSSTDPKSTQETCQSVHWCQLKWGTRSAFVMYASKSFSNAAI